MKSEILVLGGGFAGVEAAIEASKNGFDVTLVSDREYIYLYPLSIWIPIGQSGPKDTRVQLSQLSKKHGFSFVKSRVSGIDTQNQRVQLEDGDLNYETLIIALGGAKMQPEGIEKTLSICGSPEDAKRIRERLEALYEKGGGRIAVGFGGSVDDPSAVRGGPVFELLFNIETMLRRKKMRDRFELTFFSPMTDPGKKMGDTALLLLESLFRKRGIARRTGVGIAGFETNAVTFTDGTALQSDLILFTPAGKGLPLLKESGLPVSAAGYARIDDHCRVFGMENVYAIGDAAQIEGPDWIAKQGHLAEAMARVAVKDIAALKKSGQRGARGYAVDLSILCMMDTGDGAALVRRNRERSSVTVLPVVGHWMKQGWGKYWRLTRLRYIPRLPGM